MRLGGLLCLLLVFQIPDNSRPSGILIGSPCSSHTVCNYEGSDPVLNSKCSSTDSSNPGTCQCGAEFYGEVGWDMCFQGSLGEDCSTASDGDAFCQSGDANSECKAGNCACQDGYYEEEMWTGRVVCRPIEVGAACDSSAANPNQICQIRMTGGICATSSETCGCPETELFIPSNSTCQEVLHTAACQTCKSSGGICYDTDDDDAPDGCECPANKRSSGANPLATGCDIGRAEIGDMCEPSGSIECLADNSECAHGVGLAGRYLCICQPGYTLVGDGFDAVGEMKCYQSISAYTDPTCTNCVKHGGKCFDVDEDGLRDGCICPETRSSSDPLDFRTDCDTSDFDVSCSASRMTLSYLPHNTTQYSGDMSESMMAGESAIFVKGHLGTDPCMFEYLDDGSWEVVLSLNDDSEVCGMVTRFPNPNVISYQNWVILKIATNRGPQFVSFHAYCEYDVVASTMTEGMDIMGDQAMASEGVTHSPTLEMTVYDQFARDVANLGVRLGQSSQLVVRMTNDRNVFSAIRPDVCIASSHPELNNPETQTILLLHNGCPSDGSPIALQNTFHHLPDNNEISQTGLFPMIQFDNSDFIFFHCAVRVCRHDSECEQPTCTDRKRRALDPYSGAEGGWQSVKSAPIKVIRDEAGAVGEAEPAAGEVCLLGSCMSKGAGIGVIAGIVLFSLSVITVIGIVAHRAIAARRQTTSGNSTGSDDASITTNPGSNLYRPDINRPRSVTLDQTMHRRLPQEFFWEETGSEILPEDEESFYFRRYYDNPYFDMSA